MKTRTRRDKQPVTAEVAPRRAGGYECKGVVEEAVDAFPCMVEYLFTVLRRAAEAVRSQRGRHVHLPEDNMRMRRTSRVTHIDVT